jgi:hypothetical protein
MVKNNICGIILSIASVFSGIFGVFFRIEEALHKVVWVDLIFYFTNQKNIVLTLNYSTSSVTKLMCVISGEL